MTHTACIIEINITEIDHAKDTDVVMLMNNLIEYSDNYLEASGKLWHYHRDEPFIKNDGNSIDIPDDLDITSFNYKQNNNRSNKI